MARQPKPRGPSWGDIEELVKEVFGDAPDEEREVVRALVNYAIQDSGLRDTDDTLQETAGIPPLNLKVDTTGFEEGMERSKRNMDALCHSASSLVDAELKLIELAPKGTTYHCFAWDKATVMVYRQRDDGAWFTCNAPLGDEWYRENVVIRDKKTGEPWPDDVLLVRYSSLDQQAAVYKKHPDGRFAMDANGDIERGTITAMLEVLPSNAPAREVTADPNQPTLAERAREAAQNGVRVQNGIHAGSPDIPDLSHWKCETPKSEQETDTCPDCKGTKEYRGLLTVQPCATCGGSGLLNT